jgi:type I restriction enzyme S subunit
MAVEWEVMTLRDAGVQLLDCEHRTPPPAEIGYPYIAIPQVKDGRLNLGDVRLISPEHFADWTRKTRPREWDVILSRRCNPGETAFVPAGLECALGQNLVLLRAEGKRVIPEFLRWLVRSPAWWQQIGAFINVGAVFDSLKCADIPQFQLPVPPLEDQRAIARILGALDEKIELNRWMSEMLEAMARALFKSWFVDFDPVRAKAEGRDPGLPKPVADLFPARLVASEHGEIPEGWTRKPLDELARFVNGLALQKYPPGNGKSLPVIKIAQLRSRNTDDADRASGHLDPDYIVRDGDILFSWSGSLECVLWAGGPGALNQHLFKVISASHPRWLCYLGIHLHLEDFRHIAAGKATTMGHIQRHHLSDASLAIPPPPLMSAASTIMEPIVEGLWRREVQSRTLAAIRDALLPKLISGELRVKDARCAVVEAAG